LCKSTPFICAHGKANDGFSDTDDVAHRHILSLDREKVAGNQRYLVTRAEPLSLRAVAARLRKEHPELADRLPDLPQDGTAAEQKLCNVDLTKSDATFGTQWRDTYDSVAQVIFDVVRWEKEEVAKL
jgi:nucleoside-diphosphate-sugar epimerase